MFLTISQAFGGLGIFFAGMYLLSENLKRLAGRGFREAVAKWTKSLLAGVVWGTAAGAVMQSTTAITFIVVSMLGTGLLTVETGLAMVLGCNIGTSSLVIIASLNIRAFVFVTLGLAGISFASARLAGARTVLLAVFGIGLVFLGLDLLKHSVGPIAQEPWVRDMLAGAGGSYVLMFLIGAFLSFVCQSTNSITLLAITLTTGGVLGFEQCVMAIYGANVGSGVLTYVLASGLRGRQRQVAMYQVAFNVVAAVTMVPLFYVEVLGGVPLVMALARKLSGETELQLAYVYVAFNLGGVLVLLPFVGQAARILARRWPPPPEEGDAKPQYIYDQALLEPETALDLLVLEQQRLAGYMPRMLAVAREAPKDAVARIGRERRVGAELGAEIAEFAERLGEAQLSHDAYERLHGANKVQGILDGLADTVADLARAALDTRGRPATQRLGDGVLEGVDAMLLTAVAAMAPDGADDLAMLRAMGGDRGAVMRRLREGYLSADAGLSSADKVAVLTVTNLAERAAWLVGRLADALPSPPEDVGGTQDDGTAAGKEDGT